MTTLALASLGGLISFASTSMGALLSGFRRSSSPTVEGTNRWNLSIDFALGLMVSASAFSLIGPAAFGGSSRSDQITVLLAVVAGALFVYLTKLVIEKYQSNERGDQNNEQRAPAFATLQAQASTAQILLVSVLMMHNFPEGFASGAAMAGLNWQAALPILGGISIQNIPEGALMVLCLRAMGWSDRRALWGGIASGAVEMCGGVLAGVLMQYVQGVLPVLLSFAGGAMVASVFVELLESKDQALRRVWSYQFLVGLMSLPLLKLLGL